MYVIDLLPITYISMYELLTLSAAEKNIKIL